MSDSTTSTSSEAAAIPKKKRGAQSLTHGDSSVSTTISADLKEKIRQRAEHEERTEAVIMRRALRAYMKDWQPGDDD